MERWSTGSAWPIVVEKKGKTREVDLRDVVQRLESVAPGTVELAVAAIGAGARIRDVLGGLFGDHAALMEEGWSTLRIETCFGEGPQSQPKTGKKNRGRKRAVRPQGGASQ